MKITRPDKPIDAWDRQLDHDSVEGKLDFLFSEADKESAQGLVRDWPPQCARS